MDTLRHQLRDALEVLPSSCCPLAVTCAPRLRQGVTGKAFMVPRTTTNNGHRRKKVAAIQLLVYHGFHRFGATGGHGTLRSKHEIAVFKTHGTSRNCTNPCTRKYRKPRMFSNPSTTPSATLPAEPFQHEQCPQP